ncbi:uncharacterized protein LOC144115731 isoform X4 [Amblyomma americanum]
MLLGKTGGSQAEYQNASTQTSHECMFGRKVKTGSEADRPKPMTPILKEKDVEFIDWMPTLNEKNTPFTFGTVAVTNSASVGMLKLNPDQEKQMAADNAHNLFLYALDSGVMVTLVEGAWTLLAKRSTFIIQKGSPFTLKNVGVSLAKVLYVLADP